MIATPLLDVVFEEIFGDASQRCGPGDAVTLGEVDEEIGSLVHERAAIDLLPGQDAANGGLALTLRVGQPG